MELEQEFFDYLIQQNYLTPEVLHQWTAEYQKYRNIFASLPPSQLKGILKPHEKTRIIPKPQSSGNKTEVISSEMWEKIKKEQDAPAPAPLDLEASKDEIDLLLEIEKYSQTQPTKTPDSVSSLEPLSSANVPSSDAVDASTLLFHLQQSVPKKVITEFDPMMQPTRVSRDEEVNYFEMALHEKQKASEFSKIKKDSEVLDCLLKAFSFLSIVHYLNPENTVIIHEKKLLQEWLESFLLNASDS